MQRGISTQGCIRSSSLDSSARRGLVQGDVRADRAVSENWRPEKEPSSLAFNDIVRNQGVLAAKHQPIGPIPKIPLAAPENLATKDERTSIAEVSNKCDSEIEALYINTASDNLCGRVHHVSEHMPHAAPTRAFELGFNPRYIPPTHVYGINPQQERLAEIKLPSNRTMDVTPPLQDRSVGTQRSRNGTTMISQCPELPEHRYPNEPCSPSIPGEGEDASSNVVLGDDSCSKKNGILSLCGEQPINRLSSRFMEDFGLGKLHRASSNNTMPSLITSTRDFANKYPLDEATRNLRKVHSEVFVSRYEAARKASYERGPSNLRFSTSVNEGCSSSEKSSSELDEKARDRKTRISKAMLLLRWKRNGEKDRIRGAFSPSLRRPASFAPVCDATEVSSSDLVDKRDPTNEEGTSSRWSPESHAVKKKNIFRRTGHKVKRRLRSLAGEKPRKEMIRNKRTVYWSNECPQGTKMKPSDGLPSSPGTLSSIAYIDTSVVPEANGKPDGANLSQFKQIRERFVRRSVSWLGHHRRNQSRN